MLILAAWLKRVPWREIFFSKAVDTRMSRHPEVRFRLPWILLEIEMVHFGKFRAHYFYAWVLLLPDKFANPSPSYWTGKNSIVCESKTIIIWALNLLYAFSSNSQNWSMFSVQQSDFSSPVSSSQLSKCVWRTQGMLVAVSPRRILSWAVAMGVKFSCMWHMALRQWRPSSPLFPPPSPQGPSAITLPESVTLRHLPSSVPCSTPQTLPFPKKLFWPEPKLSFYLSEK